MLARGIKNTSMSFRYSFVQSTSRAGILDDFFYIRLTNIKWLHEPQATHASTIESYNIFFSN